jgi:quaternary ammonium compound-resistance protein SugE
MAWIYLLIAALFEMGWPLGIKLSQVTTYRIPWILAAGSSMVLSVLFLWIAQKQIPIGTAYAVWTGLGAVGVFVAGVILFDEPTDLLRVFSVLLIVIGVVGLKLANG